MRRLIARAKGLAEARGAVAGPDRQGAVHGVTGALDRYSRYASPEVAQDQRAAREGFGGIGITVDGRPARTFRVTRSPRGDRPTAPASGRRTRSSRSTGSRPAAACTATSCTAARPGRQPGRGDVSSRHVAAARVAASARLVILQTVTVSRDGGILVLRVNSFNHSTTKRIAEGWRSGAPEGRLRRHRARPARQSGRAARPGGQPRGFVPAPGPIVSAIGRHPASHQYFKASGSRMRAADAGGGADQRRFRLGLRDRRRRAARCRTRRRDRQLVLRQRHGADRAAAAQQRRTDPDLGPARRAVRLCAADTA